MEMMSLLSEIKEIVIKVFTESSDNGLLNPKKYMNFSLFGQLLVTLCCCLASLSLKHFPNVGFQLFITGFANLSFALGAFWVINKQPDAISVGVCIGAGIVISILSLITVAYWGELSSCEIITVAVKKYTCDAASKSSMRYLCLFSIILFVLQGFFTSYLARYKIHVLAASIQYSELPGVDESDNPDTESVFGKKSSQKAGMKGGEGNSLI
mmetsp:Transcript_27797/g.26616  ORF Transcript_27797/g.26616 Transcript_27797/m.26616 type:complete len:211 (+) Transcript_27797:226-858(+)